MMQRRPITFPQPCLAKPRLSIIIRSRPHRFTVPTLLTLHSLSHRPFWLCGLHYGLIKPAGVKRGILALSKATVKDEVLEAPRNPQWRESTDSEPSLLMIRTDLDPSSPPQLFGSAQFEAEVSERSTVRSAEEAVKQDPETTLKLVGGMRRENYAVGVFFLALSLGAANTVTQAVTTVGQKGAQVLSKAASTLDEQQKSSADRAKQWLSGLVQRSENQAAIAQESLEEWPDLLQQSLGGAVDSHNQAVHQAQANVRQWAETYVPGSADVQRLWRTAAEAARNSIAQAADTGSRRTDEGAQVELSTSTASTADTSASGSTARKEHESAAAGSRWRSETEVYAAEALAAARAAEAAWNERIRNAYASVAASTPFQSSSAQALSQDNKPVSHALSYARGGKATLARTDFAPPPSSSQRLTGSGGAGGGGTGGSGGGGGRGDESGDERPRRFLWGRLLLMASAIVAAAEQLLERHERRGLLAAIALLGALLWQGQKYQGKQPRRRTRRSLTDSFSFSGASQANRVELSDMSSDEEEF